MNPKVEGLAKRLKSVLDDYEAGRREEQAARDEALAEARQAREQLLGELAAFGRAVGHLQVKEQAGRLALSWGSQRMAFVPSGEGDALRVVLGSLAGPDEAGADVSSPVRIYRAQDDARTWMLAVAHDGVEDVEPLFDRGLVHLLIEGLSLPLPPPAPRSQPPLDALVPGED